MSDILKDPVFLALCAAITGFEEVFDKDALIPDLIVIAYLEEV